MYDGEHPPPAEELRAEYTGRFTDYEKNTNVKSIDAMKIEETCKSRLLADQNESVGMTFLTWTWLPKCTAATDSKPVQIALSSANFHA